MSGTVSPHSCSRTLPVPGPGGRRAGRGLGGTAPVLVALAAALASGGGALGRHFVGVFPLGLGELDAQRTILQIHAVDVTGGRVFFNISGSSSVFQCSTTEESERRYAPFPQSVVVLLLPPNLCSFC